MKRWTGVVAAMAGVGLCVFLIGHAQHIYGETGENRELLYFAQEIPEDRLSQIRIDGDLSDWEWMAPLFLGTEEFPLRPMGTSEESFDVETYVGWSSKTNRLYFAVKVTDNQLYTLPLDQAHGMHRADLFQIYVDADHSGGIYRGEHDSRQAQQYYLYVLPDGSGHFGLFGPEEDLSWSLVPPYAEYAVRYDGTAIYYEVAMSLWDWLDRSPSESKQHILKAGETIGWKITLKDRDGIMDHVHVCTLRPIDAWKNADTFSDLMLW